MENLYHSERIMAAHKGDQREFLNAAKQEEEIITTYFGRNIVECLLKYLRDETINNDSKNQE